VNSEKLKNRAVLVTGGAKRVGRGIAFLFASLGYDIALHYNNSEDEAVKTVEKIIEKYNVKCIKYKADLANETELDILIDNVFNNFPNIDILINSASIFTRAKIQETSYDIFSRNFNINFKAPFFLTKLFCQKIISSSKKDSNSYNIINILDTKIDKKNQTVYSAYSLSKMALAEFTKLSAIEYAEHNIRINGVAIGTILPPKEVTDYNNPEILKQKNLLKKNGNIKNLTKTLSFIIDNDFITGEIIFVDGGEKLI